MQERLIKLKNQIRNYKLQKQLRINIFNREYALTECKNLDKYSANAKIFELYTQFEDPVILPNANFAFSHSFKYSLYPMIFNDEYDKLTNHGHPVTGSFVKNMSPDWGIFLTRGLKHYIDSINNLDINTLLPEQIQFIQAAKSIFLNIKNLQERYYKHALKLNNIKLANILKNVPYEKPTTFHEALQSLLFMFHMVRLSQANHIGFHRLDQYLYSYYKSDIDNGILTENEALELLEEWFIMLNIDSDVYSAMQTGDSGMTVMLGGISEAGIDQCNALTELILKASYNVEMLEPKINLRISSKTPHHILELAAKLTERGLGYPQYCNDEVIIPGLIKFGYPGSDAYDYTVAACWEFIVKNGMDTPNALYLDMPLAVENCIETALSTNKSFDDILKSLKSEFKLQIEKQFSSKQITKYIPNVLISCLCGNCFEKCCDIFDNSDMHFFYGCHGVGSSTAVNQLLAVKRLCYDSNEISRSELLNAVHNNFIGYEDLRIKLETCQDKLCTDNQFANEVLKIIFDAFSDALLDLKLNNKRIRPGTGSAQFYAVLTQGDTAELGATCDGRKKGDYIASSLAPAPKTKARGLLSTLYTFSHIDYDKICNGGPITVEMTPDFFEKSNIDKFINYIQMFIKFKCQQLQVNILDKNKLLDAQKYPENYKNLIVRVWGWSGYFIELDKKYQDQIINRLTYN